MNIVERLRWALALAASVAGMLVFVAIQAPRASADAFGELGQVGQAGVEPGEFQAPGGLAVDTADNSVFVVDAPVGSPAPGTHSEFRIQKFTAALGAPVASVMVSTPKLEEGGQFIAGIAVDSSLERLYVLKARNSEEVTSQQFSANEIVVYSTKEKTVSGVSTLSLAEGFPSGVFYKFSQPVAADTVELPSGLAVDPTTHDVLVLGEDNSGNTVVERISSSGSLGNVYDDGTAHAFGPPGWTPSGLVVAPDGTIYFAVDYSTEKKEGGFPGVVKATADLSTVSVVHQAKELPSLTGGALGGSGTGYGPQVAVDAEGKLVYAAQVTQPEGNGTAGNYQVRGMSTADGSQQVVYGGGTSTCWIATRDSAIATGSGGVLYVLDEGALVSGKPTSYGYHLIKFGPGGSGCPAPLTSILVNGDSASPTVAVQKGEEAQIEASSAELHGEEPTELVWEGEGPEKFKTEVSGTPASLKLTHKFLKPGLYTLTLNMKVSPATLGSPPAVTRKVEVVAPPPTAHFEASKTEAAPGETVTFNASESSDPTGSPTGGPTKQLKSYTWNFGDGSAPVTAKSPEIAHAFANAGTAPLHDTVTLTVTNEEEVQSAPTTQVLTIEGTPAPPVEESKKTTVEEKPLLTPLPDRTPTDLSPSVAGGSGQISLTLSCPATKVSCGAAVTVKATPKAKSARHKKGKHASAVTIAQGSFGLAAGQHQTFVVRLSAKGLALLKKEKTLKVQVLVAAHDSFGDPKTSTLMLSLHAPSKHKGNVKHKHG